MNKTIVFSALNLGLKAMQTQRAVYSQRCESGSPKHQIYLAHADAEIKSVKDAITHVLTDHPNQLLEIVTRLKQRKVIPTNWQPPADWS